MKNWPIKCKTPKFGICNVKEMTDKECLKASVKRINWAPRSHGFVNLFQNDNFVGWCGIAYAKRRILGGSKIKLPKYIRDIPV